MDAMELLKELKLMCENNKNCTDCILYKYDLANVCTLPEDLTEKEMENVITLCKQNKEKKERNKENE